MAEFRWIKMTLFVIMLLHFAAVTGQTLPSFIARVGGEVTLPCNNVMNDQHKCDGTSWQTSRYPGDPSKELINLGQINKDFVSQAESDRLNVTEKCSLVIRNVRLNDVGRYTCRQFRSGQQQGSDAQVVLSAVNMEDNGNDNGNDTVRLYCTVKTYAGCGHTVEWLYEGNKNDVETTQRTCTATVTFTTSDVNQKSNYYKLLKCNVTDNNSGEMLLCPADLQSPCEKTEEGNQTPGEDTPTNQGWRWYHIIAALGLAVLLAAIIAVAVIRRKRTEGNKTKVDENMGLSLNTAVAPKAIQDTADPEDGVSYASVSYTKKTNSKGQILGNNDDEGDAVTYSTVKAPSSSAGASADPSDLYATINQPNQ